MDKNQTVVECWQFTIPEMQSALTARYLLQENSETGNLSIYILDREGIWVEADYTLDGSYAVFSMASNAQQIAIISQQTPLWIYLAAGALAIAAITTTLIICAHKKRKQTE